MVPSLRKAALAALAVACLSDFPVCAQTYPAKPIKIVIPFAAGGGVDISTRVVVEAAGVEFGQSFVVENNGGGGTVAGTQVVVHAPADGYTLLAMPTTTVINAATRPSLPYDWRADLTPVALVIKLPFVVSGGQQLKAGSMKELAELAKASPAPLTFGSGGAGTVAHLAGELFALRTGAKLSHVSYRGEAPALNDAVGGHIAVMFSTLPGAAGLIEGGKLKPLGVTTKARAGLLPQVPTVAEQGYPDYDVSAWVAIAGPKGLAADVVSRLSAALAKAVGSAAVRERLVKIGAEPATATAAELRAFLDSEAKLWAGVIRDANVKIE